MEQHFSKLPKINGEFQFGKVNYSRKHHDELEPLDGIISYNGVVFYFKYHGDFWEGNRYLVYEKEMPVFWFTLSHPYVNPDNGFPVHDPDEFIEDARDLEDDTFPKWHSS